MIRKIITSIVASSMLVTVSIGSAFGAVITQQGPTLIEINAGIQAGTGFAHYPVAGGNAAPVGFILNDVLPEGTALPQVTDASALLDAINQGSVVLVADNSNTLFLPAIYAELGKQNGMTAIEFFQYISGLTNEQLHEMTKEHTEALIATANIDKVEIDVPKLVSAGISKEDAQKLVDAALLEAASKATAAIKALDNELQAKISEIVILNMEIARLNALDPEVVTVTEVVTKTVNILNPVNAELEATRDFLQSILVERSLQLGELTGRVQAAYAVSTETVAPTGVERTVDGNAVAIGVTAFASNSLAGVISSSTSYTDTLIRVNSILFLIQAQVEAIINLAYDQGYSAGYADGFRDGVNSVKSELRY